MNADYFEQKYLEFEGIALSKYKIGRGSLFIGKENLRLLQLLSEEIGDNRFLIPNIGSGELALCVNQADAFSLSRDVIEALEDSGLSAGIRLINDDFSQASIPNNYKAIILFPPFGMRMEQGRSEAVYIEKTLDLLEEDGTLIMLVPQSFLTAAFFQRIRERIVNDYSLEAVFTLGRLCRDAAVNCSVIVVRNRPQCERVFMTLGNENVESLYIGYREGTDGFYVSADEVYDRFDASFYNPEYKEIRKQIQSRDTVKLGEISDIFSGVMIPSNERKDYGEYLIIRPNYIHNGEVTIDGKKVYCSSGFVDSNNRGKRSVLRNGDVLILTAFRLDWAVYRGQDDFAIVNQNITVVRGKQEYQEWLQLFFSSKTGLEAMESQLKLLSHESVVHQISIKGLAEMYVPDVNLMKAAERIGMAVDQEAKVVSLFKELGWTVKENVAGIDLSYDLVLLDNDVVKGVVDFKAYKSNQFVRNREVVSRLLSIKRRVGDVAVYLFVDDTLFELINGSLVQLKELPRPGKSKVTTKIESIRQEPGASIPIERVGVEETSLYDRLLTEITLHHDELLSKMNRIEEKVDIIVERLEQLYKLISGYQSLVDKQLDLAVSPGEEERIIHAFSEECAERIIGEVSAKNSEKEYNTELNKLVLSFGEDAWKKMDESSQTFLVSSKVIFNNLVGLQDIVDYSGVCLLVTKALEVEMSKRFCKNYIAYLKEKYPGKANYANYPSTLLDQYCKPIKPKHFTLGSVAYVLCYLKAEGLTEEQEINNKEKLIEYCKARLFKCKTDNEIMKTLLDYAESVEEVKTDYRNPSAHTNELRKIDAEQCFDLVIDVEKLMKKMLDSFDE